MEKTAWGASENAARFPLSHHPGGCGLTDEGQGAAGLSGGCEVPADVVGFGVEPDEQFVRQSDADNFRWFAGGGQSLAEGHEVRLIIRLAPEILLCQERATNAEGSLTMTDFS